jgi:hypothetical protein
MRNNSDEQQYYSEKLKDPRWQKKRLEILQRDNFKCKLCGDEKTSLQVHHKEYINGNDPWNYPDISLITLCEHCHLEIEKLRENNIDTNKIISILKFKNNVSIIIFTSFPGFCTVGFHDSNNKFLLGCQFDDDNLLSIIKIFQDSINGKEIH